MNGVLHVKRSNGKRLMSWSWSVSRKRECRESRKREREREANIPRGTWKTNKALTQDLYRSRRHRASSRGGLENPSGKVSLAGFHSAKSWPWRRRRNLNLPGFSTQNGRSGVRVGEVWKKNETGTLQEQITFNEARRGRSQISELLHLSKKRVSIYRHVCRKLLS